MKPNPKKPWTEDMCQYAVFFLHQSLGLVLKEGVRVLDGGQIYYGDVPVGSMSFPEKNEDSGFMQSNLILDKPITYIVAEGIL